MQRTVVTRDPSGNVRREIYRPTKGLLHDTTAPLERVLTGSTSTVKEFFSARSPKDTAEQDDDLGTSQFSGFPAKGKRQTFRDSGGQLTHTLETWYSSSLGLTVHMQSSNARGDTAIIDLSELHLGTPASSPSETAATTSHTIPLLVLYRGLFTHIAHMERDRQTNDPNRHVNMGEIEDHLRKKLNLSASEWQILVDKSVKVESYTRDMSQKARSFADQDRAARRENPLSAHTLAAGRATLHNMQLDLNMHVQAEIDELKKSVGETATEHIQNYLQGPQAASTSVIHVNLAQLRAQRAQKEQTR
jgi:hypothetical protein